MSRIELEDSITEREENRTGLEDDSQQRNRQRLPNNSNQVINEP
jgi:hypothetical protein